MKQILLITLIALTPFSSNAMEINNDLEKGKTEKSSLLPIKNKNGGYLFDSRLTHQGITLTILILGLTSSIFSWKKFDSAEKALALCNPDAASNIESFTALPPMLFMIVLGAIHLVHIASK